MENTLQINMFFFVTQYGHTCKVFSWLPFYILKCYKINLNFFKSPYGFNTIRQTSERSKSKAGITLFIPCILQTMFVAVKSPIMHYKELSMKTYTSPKTQHFFPRFYEELSGVKVCFRVKSQILSFIYNVSRIWWIRRGLVQSTGDVPGLLLGEERGANIGLFRTWNTWLGNN